MTLIQTGNSDETPTTPITPAVPTTKKGRGRPRKTKTPAESKTEAATAASLSLGAFPSGVKRKKPKIKELEQAESPVPQALTPAQTQLETKRSKAVPNVVVINILDFLKPEEIARASATSQQFYRAAHQRVSNLMVHFKGQFGPKKFERLLTEFQLPKEEYDPKIVDESINANFESLKNLIKVVRGSDFAPLDIDTLKSSTENYKILKKIEKDFLLFGEILTLYGGDVVNPIMAEEGISKETGYPIDIDKGNLKYIEFSDSTREKLNNLRERAKLIREAESLRLPQDIAIKLGFTIDAEDEKIIIPEKIEKAQLDQLNQWIEDENLIKAVDRNLPQRYRKELFELGRPEAHHEKAEKIRQYLKKEQKEWGASWDLEAIGLTRFPVELCQLENIKFLNLANNKLRNLPKEFNNLRNLIILNLSWNDLENLPHGIFKNLINLQKLFIKKNGLLTLPVSIVLCLNLREIDASDNKIPMIPERIGNLTKLRILDLHSNPLRELPKSIRNCNSLERLNLNNTNVKNLLDLSNMNNLEYLWLYRDTEEINAEHLVHYNKYFHAFIKLINKGKLPKLKHIITTVSPKITVPFIPNVTILRSSDLLSVTYIFGNIFLQNPESSIYTSNESEKKLKRETCVRIASKVIVVASFVSLFSLASLWLYMTNKS